MKKCTCFLKKKAEEGISQFRGPRVSGNSPLVVLRGLDGSQLVLLSRGLCFCQHRAEWPLRVCYLAQMDPYWNSKWCHDSPHPQSPLDNMLSRIIPGLQFRIYKPAGSFHMLRVFQNMGCI